MEKLDLFVLLWLIGSGAMVLSGYLSKLEKDSWSYVVFIVGMFFFTGACSPVLGKLNYFTGLVLGIGFMLYIVLLTYAGSKYLGAKENKEHLIE